MFEKSLNDLVRGIRAHRSNEASFKMSFPVVFVIT